MTQQNAALVEESAAAAQSLREQATRLAGAVQVFKLSPGDGSDGSDGSSGDDGRPPTDALAALAAPNARTARTARAPARLQ